MDLPRGKLWAMGFFDEVVAEPTRTAMDAKVYDPVILSPVGEIAVLAAGMLGGVRAARPLHPAKVYTIGRLGGRFSLVGPCMGAPVAAMALEKCIAQGVSNVIFLGFVGSINKKARLGDIIVVDGAVSEEGTSKHYFPDKFPPVAGPRATAALEQALNKKRIQYQKGRVWTCDAFYRETWDKVRSYGGQGVLGVEMELAAMFTIARFRSIDLGAIVVVSDELFELKWLTGYTKPVVLKSIKNAIAATGDAAGGML